MNKNIYLLDTNKNVFRCIESQKGIVRYALEIGATVINSLDEVTDHEAEIIAIDGYMLYQRQERYIC